MPEQVIETPEGYHVVMLIGKRSASHRPLETVRNELIPCCTVDFECFLADRLGIVAVEFLDREVETLHHGPNHLESLPVQVRLGKPKSVPAVMMRDSKSGSPAIPPWSRIMSFGKSCTGSPGVRGPV